jgi:hypothetical protein
MLVVITAWRELARLSNIERTIFASFIFPCLGTDPVLLSRVVPDPQFFLTSVHLFPINPLNFQRHTTSTCNQGAAKSGRSARD